MVIREIYISNDMIAAGVEALKEARLLCMEEGDIVIEIYLAMLGRSLIEPEVVH